MERRSTFRFRLPWSAASEPEPASKSSTQSNTKTTGSSRTTRQGTRSRTTSQPTSSTRPKTSPSASPTTENSTPKQPPSATTTTTSGKPSSPPTASTTTPQSRSRQPQNSPETKAPSQPTTTSTRRLTETPVISPQSSAENKAPIKSTTNKSPLPESSQVPSQPSAESKAPIQSSTTNSKPTNAPASPSGVAPSITESQPSQEQQGITSQPSSPSDVATKSNAPEAPSPSQSPSRPAPQSQELSPKSSPTRNGPQVLSTNQLTPKAASLVSQTSSNPSADITSQMQPNDQTISQPTSPPKQSQDSSEISPKSTKPLLSNSEKEPMPATVWTQSEQMELLKREAIADTLTEAKDRSPEKVMQRSELSEVSSTRGITEGPSKISDLSSIVNEPKTARPLETNIPETKEVKEVVQETTGKNYGPGEKIDGFLTSKEHPGAVFQSKQTNSDHDQIRVNRVSNGKQTRTISAEQDIPLNKEVKDNISKFIHRMAVGDGKKDLEKGPVSVITLAGDNRGAYMQLGSNSSRKGREVHIHRGYKLNADENADATTDAEGNSEGRQLNDTRTMKDKELEAYMNCNVQGLNNSITFDSTIEGKNPGIHMSFPRMRSEPTKSSDRTGLFEAHKAEFNVTRAQKHTYEPTVRRRCLEGLFFEPSDSDSDNQEKPRRHGCQVGGIEKTDNDIDIL
ncbi:flocculation protein FLO11-like [Solanum dulcamara]|uniref:flocculation protein FLO11-like n=1 Tax=Solanum dulcamara TaxID=45834 RepID=UPI0024868EDD|nr:flocculation protein FLO11-like [Solanum dulcamara]